ncbi:hypothetical protein JOF44_003891 [Brachybacterium fresconis]|uniref:Uncharacterized protein n=1 Tax=Brachybacterium fresconis TaxID=173363 RepID=A0ABS4YQB1_9MICO|nr:hypothetical protein [Brachybacterium fresconis]
MIAEVVRNSVHPGSANWWKSRRQATSWSWSWSATLTCTPRFDRQKDTFASYCFMTVIVTGMTVIATGWAVVD